MKKYETLGELLIDYRDFNNISQAELAEKLDVDRRTVYRWENDEALIKTHKEADVVALLNIPKQVIRNLNSEAPIVIYYDMKLRTYSLSAAMAKAESVAWYKSELPKEDDLIHYISKDSDVEFVNDIQQMNNNLKPIRAELVKEAAKLLPELNLVLQDKSGYYAGHITVLPLKYSSYQKIKNREMNEGSLTLNDLCTHFTDRPLVFYFYSIYAESLHDSYHLMNRLLSWFKEKKFNDYLFAGISYRQNKIELLREMGLKIIWEDKNPKGSAGSFTLMEGNFDMFLFGKMG